MPRFSLPAVACLLAALWAGCRAHSGVSPANRWATAWVEGLNSRRLEQLAAVCVPTVTYEDPLTGGPRSGPTLGYYFSVMWQKHPSAQYHVARVNDGDGWVIVEWKATGLSDSGELAGVFILQLQNNAIARVRGYFDASALS